MRIAIASDWFAPRRGGIETQLAGLAMQLSARGHVVDVFTSTPGAHSDSPIRVREVETWRVPRLDLALSPRLAHTLRAELDGGYDVVHTNVSVVSPFGYGAAIAARSLGLPTVVSFHSILHRKRVLLGAADRMLGLSRGPVVWTGVSNLVTAQLRQAMPAAHVDVLPNGTDVGFWRDAPPRGRSSHLTFVSVSRLHRKKRPVALLHAFAAARRSVTPAARLLFVGEGPELASIQRTIRDAGLDTGHHRAEVRGWVSREELRSILAGADAFVLASKNESFGIAALEARAAGLPVIAMRASGSSEFLCHGRDALLCDDDADLASAIARLATDPSLRARLSASAFSATEYDWPAVAARHEAVYGLAIARASMQSGAVAASA